VKVPRSAPPSIIGTRVDGDYVYSKYSAQGHELRFGCECRTHIATGVVELPLFLVNMMMQEDFLQDASIAKSQSAFRHPVSQAIYVNGQEIPVRTDEHAASNIRQVESLELLEFSLSNVALH
jgi:hypothetical protein